MRVAVDIGGTFTDAVVIDDTGEIRSVKTLTTPGRLHDGVLNAAQKLNVNWSDVGLFIHGTTVGLNAFLERRGVRIALVTTEGFGDVYEIGRANRPDMYNVRYRPPAPLVRRRSVFEINERLAASGEELVPVDEREVRRLGRMLGKEYGAVALCLLHAYTNPGHEKRVRDLIREEAPSLPVVASHEVAPEWREYERTSTTAIAAYIAPIVEDYLGELGDRVGTLGLVGPLRVMQSNGGVMTAEMARRKPIQTLFSGPVGGAVACVALANDLMDEWDVDRMVCVDMGGTSFDMSLVIDGKAQVELESSLEGHKILAPAVAIHTIGAGGGSVGHSESGGLRVGPRSAGAVPGPACYGKGGVEPTITDANLHLGRIPTAARLAGGIELDNHAAAAALNRVGSQVGLGTEQMASGMIKVADALMANAIREITVSRGIDPRDFALVAFGGAGPLHALAIADELAIDRVIVPANPGVLSAYGMLQSDSRHDVVQSFFVRVAEVAPTDLARVLADLAVRGRAMLREDSIDDEQMVFEWSADLRYSGQEYTVTLKLDLDSGEAALLEHLPYEFAIAYNARYGHSNPGESVEFVNVRITAYGRVPRITPKHLPQQESTSKPLAVDTAWFDGEWTDIEVYARDALGRGARIRGPAIVLEEACTILVRPRWDLTVSTNGHLLLSRIQ